MTFDFDRIVATLDDHGVAYVLIGGAAAILYGSTLPTEDVDIVPSRDSTNLESLASALRDLNARIRTSSEPRGVEFPYEAAFLAAMPLMLNLTTAAGDLDLTFAPGAFPDGYEALTLRAVEVDLGAGLTARIAALDDIIASKRAANRAKDKAALPYLEALADDIARGH